MNEATKLRRTQPSMEDHSGLLHVSSGLAWTWNAFTALLVGCLLLLVGAWATAPALILFGGVLSAAVLLDGAFVRGSSVNGTLQVSQSRVREGDRLDVKVDIHQAQKNQQLHIRLSPGFDLESGHENLLGAAQDARQRRFPVIPRARGPHTVGPMTVRTWSPLRFWALDNVAAEAVTVEVVPRLEDIESIGLLSKVLKPMQGRFQVNRPGQGFDFFTLRHYASGDTIRDVNWKASARSEELIVNQRQVETFSEVTFFLDSRLPSGVGPVGGTPLDRGCRLVLSMFIDAAKSRDTARFFAYGSGIRQRPESRDHIRAMEDLLANLEPDGKASLQDAWETAKTDIRSSGPIFIVTSAEGDEGVVHACAGMVGRGHPVTVVSPCPTGPGWQNDEWRQKRREKTLNALRGTGAVVVDWTTGTVQAEKPMPVKVTS